MIGYSKPSNILGGLVDRSNWDLVISRSERTAYTCPLT